jgi:hypothetical protein
VHADLIDSAGSEAEVGAEHVGRMRRTFVLCDVTAAQV